MRLHRTNVSLLFLLIGALLCILAINIEHDIWTHIIKDFGVVIASLAVVDILWRWAGGDPVSLELQEIKNQLRLTTRLSELGI
jgi:hypothetical protein